jgi:hypothetical protein
MRDRSALLVLPAVIFFGVRRAGKPLFEFRVPRMTVNG